MFDFLKKRKQLKVYKIFKIIDSEDEESIDVKKWAGLLIELWRSLFNENPGFYAIDYSNKKWSTRKGFEKAILNRKSEDLMYVWLSTGSESKSFNFMNIINPRKNHYNLPKKYSVQLNIVLEADYAENENITSFFSKDYKNFLFDYGYVLNIDSSYDILTEEKKNTKSSNYNERSLWRDYKAGLAYGYIKSVYPINYLNPMHLARPEIINLMGKGVGSFRPLNEHITIWKLSTKEQKLAKSELERTEMLIAVNPANNKFLQTDDAKKFKEWMDYS